ncbi:MAG: HEAT repeat domain-containing protein [Planctomycetota bacterium]|nr:HEAT repeat domain-containing protein [Planctomycetota bacterium]
MASSLAKTLLASVVAAIVAGSAMAQDPFQDGVKLLRLGKKDEALVAFQGILKSDPSNAEAMRLYSSIGQDEWYMLLSEQGEIQKIAASILERAKLERKQQSRDASAIDALVEIVCAKDGSYSDRRDAVIKLVADHGEFAVPAFVARMANADDESGQIQAIAALVQVGPRAVMPLIEALKSTSGLLRLNAAATLTHINDERSVPAMARLAQVDDQENVKAVARRFLEGRKEKGKAVTLLLAQSRAYLKSGVMPGAYSDVVWSLKNDKLEATVVPALIYAAELSKSAANDAVQVDPGSEDARSVLAQANLAEANLIETSIAQGDATAKALEPMAAEFKMAALATGPAILRKALEDGVKSGMPNVAVAAIDALAMVEERGELATSTLKSALGSDDKRIRYAAAVALAKASGGVNVPDSDKVVNVLAAAVIEESVRMIQLIGAGGDFTTASKEAAAQRGSSVWSDANATSGMRQLLENPNVDIVVINEILDGGLPEDIIGNIKKDPRMASAKIVIVAKDTEKAQARFGETIHGVIKAPLTKETLNEAINTALAGVAAEPQNVRAESYAKSASESLLTLAAGKSNIKNALVSLAGQLNRGDSIAVPAAKALGLSGGEPQLDALLMALTGSGSVDLKVAAAGALGQILGRAKTCPKPVAEGLMAALNSDADVKVRSAAAAALGKAKVDPAEKAKLLDSMKKIGVAAAQG